MYRKSIQCSTSTSHTKRNGLKRFWAYSYLTILSSRNISSTSSSSTSVNVNVNALNICILVGSTRESGPPRPLLSNRVTRFIESSIKNRPPSSSSTEDDQQQQQQQQPPHKHNVSILHAKDLPLLVKPHFAYSKSQLPTQLSNFHTILNESDAYITITPEYNHSPCPGLLNLMNHFGSSTFSFKPSGIVSYSAGQWGGTRAAHSLRPFLSELGCLPVSAMVHIPKAMDVLDEEGNIIESNGSDGDDNDNEQAQQRWATYVDRMIYQVEFWAEAAKQQREVEDPTKRSPAFLKRPSDRNAPS